MAQTTYRVRLHRRGRGDLEVIPDTQFPTHAAAHEWATEKVAVDLRYVGFAIDKLVPTTHSMIVMPHGAYRPTD